MKISVAKADSFTKKIDKSLFSVLVYGPDIGLVSQRADIIAKQIVDDIRDPFLCADLSSEMLKDEPFLLSDEVHALSFVSGRRLIRIRDAGNTLSSTIKEVLIGAKADIIEGSFILVTAGDLNPSSSLRKLFESSKNAASLPCYQDDARSLTTVIQEEFRKRNILYDRDVIPYLAENCRGDRLVVLQEIEKLFLYISGKDKVTLHDARLSVGETTESSFDDICMAVADGNQVNIERHLRKATQQGAVPIAILRVAQRYFMKIHSVASMVNKGTPQNQVIDSLRPPIFFKQKPVFNRHVTMWNRGNILWSAMNILYEAELECKKTGANTELVCHRFLMRTASLSRQKI